LDEDVTKTSRPHQLGELQRGEGGAPANPMDQYGLAGLERGARHQHAPGRHVRKSKDARLLVIHVVRPGIAVAGRHRYLLGKRPRPALSHDPEGHALTLLAPPAELAMAAAQGRIDDDLLPHLRALHARACLRHGAERVAAQDVRRLQLGAGSSFANPDVQMVQARAHDVQHNLARTRSRRIDLLHLHDIQIPMLVYHRCLHGRNPQIACVHQSSVKDWLTYIPIL
jgi:hypothetical protein